MPFFVRHAWLVLGLLLVHPAYARDTNFCGPNFLRQLDDLLDDRPLSGARLGDPKTLTEDFATFTKVTEVDNREFNQMQEAANAGKPSKAKLFMDSEMAVAKQANDKFVGDKDIVTAASNLHKEITWRKISRDPELIDNLVGQYSDFKSMRFAFADDTPALRARLKSHLTEINREYDAALAELSNKLGWEEKARGIAKNRRDWFHGGIGASPDEAGLAARQSRAMKNSEGVSELRSFEEVTDRLEKAGQDFQRLQRWGEDRFKNVDGMLTEVGNGKKVLSPEAIEAYKKVVPKADTQEAFIAAVQKDFKERFGVELKNQQVLNLQKYLDYTDQFSPGIFVDKRVEINLGKRNHGIVSGDFKGQNARNFHETMKALVETEGRTFAERVRAVRQGENRATYALNQKKEVYKKSVKQVFGDIDPDWEKNVFFTGDDGIYLPAQALTPAKEKEFMAAWLQNAGAGDLRQTFIPASYGDSGKLIPAMERSQYLVAAESVEKKMRGALINKLPRQALNEVQFAVRYQPFSNPGTKPVVDIYIRPNAGQPVPAGVRTAVRSYLQENGYRFKLVDAESVRRVPASNP